MTETKTPPLQLVGADAQRMSVLAQDYLNNHEALAAMKEEEDRLKQALTDAMRELELPSSWSAGGYGVQLAPTQGRATLDKLALLALGVSPRIIEQATRVGVPGTRLVVEKVGG
ncbi:MAG: hypothetical protein Q8O76_12445 [Chloroflexota bacterium]|nr:hypothetical protein [Chloroflexota bacterium]